MPPRRPGVADLALHRARRGLQAVQRRRRPRAAAASGLTVRVELVDAAPPVVRHLELPSTLRLDELHGVLQAAFGWDDTHLHRFTTGASVWDGEGGELFLCALDVEEGEPDGVPEVQVRLDEVLAEPGDALVYVYDFGDEWTHRLVVEQTGPAVASPRLLDGLNGAPPEDSGGVPAWNAAPGDPPPFDLAAAERALQRWRTVRALPPELHDLLRHLTGSREEGVLRGLVEAAGLDEDAPGDAVPGAAEAVRRYAWLLAQVRHGVSLTAAGWLPPALVTQAMDELWPDSRWLGKRNREDLTEPVRRLRATARRLGLVRVVKGRLLLTRAGLALRDDPDGLFRHVATRASGSPADPFTRTVTALYLLAVAAGRPDEEPLVPLLQAAGWSRAGGEPLASWTVLDRSRDLLEVLDVVGALPDDVGRGGGVTPAGRALARLALRDRTS